MFTIDVIKSTNVEDNSLVEKGYYDASGSLVNSSTYCHGAKVNVKEGDIVRVVTDNTVNWKGIVLFSGETLLGVTSNGGTYSPTRTYIKIDDVGYFYYSITIPSGVDGIVYQRAVKINGVADMMVINSEMPTSYEEYHYEAHYGLSENVKLLTNNITDFEESVKETVNKNSPLYGKKIGFIGDSFTDVSYYYGSKIEERTGCIAYNYGKQGSRITLDNSWTSNGETVTVESFIHRAYDMEPALDIVCMFGGINDASKYSLTNSQYGTIEDVPLTADEIESGTEPTTLYQGIKTLIEVMMTLYPEKPLFFVIPPHVLTADYSPSITAYTGIEKVVAAEREVMEYYGVPVIDLYKDCMQLNNFSGNVAKYRLSATDIHPNGKGQEAMSWLIQKGIENRLV